MTWDEIIEELTESLYAEAEESSILHSLRSYVERMTKASNQEVKNLLTSGYYINLVGEPVLQIRFQLERLGIITTYTRSTTDTVFHRTRTSTNLCWALTLKGRAYISELKAIRRT